MRFSTSAQIAAFLITIAAVTVARPALGEKPRVLLGCYALPETVHASEPVAISGSALYLDMEKPANYTWQSTGGRLTPANEHAKINTSGLAPGEYTVTGHVSQGTKPNQQSTCTTRFRVIPFEPPSVTCRVTPSSIPSGGSVDINNIAISPQNRPFTYAFSVSAGHLTNTGSIAKLTTANVPAGVIHVTCYAVDDKGLSASATTDVTITKQLVNSQLGIRHLCSLNFNRDPQFPTRVDGPSENCLDSIAVTLQMNPTSRVVVVGNASPSEAPEAAAERSMNERDYLVRVKGVSPVRIQLRVGVTSGPTVDNTLVAQGLEFNEPNTQLFDETVIARHGAPYVVISPSPKRPSTPLRNSYQGH